VDVTMEVLDHVFHDFDQYVPRQLSHVISPNRKVWSLLLVV
jgi:hypothetical protein